MLEELKINKNKNNINGIFAIGDQKFFYKFLSLDDYKKEVDGYNILKKYYPVAKLIFNKKINPQKGLLIFEYEKSIGGKGKLLVDLFSNSKTFKQDRNEITKILNVYKKVFLKTIKRTNKISSNVFFKDRIKTRLDKYYDKKFIEKYTNRKIRLNNFLISLNLDETINSIKKYFSKDKYYWSVITQCDPNDLNITTKPVVFDYLAGGYNPLMAEFAVFFWYNLTQGNYLSPLYNKNFIDFPNIYDNLDKVILKRDKIIHKINQKRKDFIIEYINKVIYPVFKKTNNYNDWYDDFRNHFAMKVLAVFNVTKMKKKDIYLSLGYLELFYNNLKINNIKDLKKVINNL